MLIQQAGDLDAVEDTEVAGMTVVVVEAIGEKSVEAAVEADWGW